MPTKVGLCGRRRVVLWPSHASEQPSTALETGSIPAMSRKLAQKESISAADVVSGPVAWSRGQEDRLVPSAHPVPELLNFLAGPRPGAGRSVPFQSLLMTFRARTLQVRPSVTGYGDGPDVLASGRTPTPLWVRVQDIFLVSASGGTLLAASTPAYVTARSEASMGRRKPRCPLETP